MAANVYFRVTSLERPLVQVIDEYGQQTGPDTSAPVIIRGFVNDSRFPNQITIVCTDAGVIAEFKVGSSIAALNAWLQTWVSTNCGDDYFERGAYYSTDSDLTATQQAYIGTEVVGP